jgi:hypothetical protein
VNERQQKAATGADAVTALYAEGSALPLGLLLCYHKPMVKSTSDNTTPRWKRSAVKGTLIGVRLQPSQLKALDAWIDKQDASLTRPEAMRAMMAAEIKTPHHFKLPQKTEKHSQDEKTGRRAK